MKFLEKRTTEIVSCAGGVNSLSNPGCRGESQGARSCSLAFSGCVENQLVSLYNVGKYS